MIRIENGTIYHTDKDGKAKNMGSILFQIFANMDLINLGQYLITRSTFFKIVILILSKD